MLPPLPTINDAIGLLAALADKDRTAKMLAELAEHSGHAAEALTAARAAQKAADASSAEQAKRHHETDSHLVGREQKVLAGEAMLEKRQQEHRQTVASWEALLRKGRDELAARQAEFETQAGRTALRINDLAGKEAALNDKEKRLFDWEKRLTSLSELLKPIADKLGAKL